MKIRNKWSGFTIIELMVVISIIGILSAIIYASFDGAREDARNKAFAIEMKDVQLAIELYKSQEGRYPEVYDSGSCYSLNGNNPDSSIRGASTCVDSNPMIKGLVPDFIAELPSYTKSGNPDCTMIYSVEDDGAFYKLTAERCLAGADSPAEGVKANDELARFPSYKQASSPDRKNPLKPEFYESFAIYSLGGEDQN